MCYSFEEAGRYLETYKSYENKPPDLIMEKSEGTYMSQVNITSFTVCYIVTCCSFFNHAFEFAVAVQKLSCDSPEKLYHTQLQTIKAGLMPLNF